MVAMWECGPEEVWTCGHVDLRGFGCLEPCEMWMCGPVDMSMRGHVGLWN